MVTPADSAAGRRFGLIVWTCESTAPGVAIRPYAVIGAVCGPIGRSMPSRDARVAGPPDADDPPVLDPDVGLHDADDGVDDEGADHDRVQLGRAGLRGLRHADAEVLRVAPDRLVARRLAILADTDAEACVAEADEVARRGPEPGEPLGTREAGHPAPAPAVGPGGSRSCPIRISAA